MNPCHRFRESMFDFFDGELDALRKKDLERHLQECSRCARFLDQILLLRSHLKTLTPVKTSDSFLVLLRERIRREVAGKRRTGVVSVSFARRWIPAFSLGILVLIMGFWVLDQKTSFFDSIDSNRRITSSALPEDGNFDGQVQYVIDDFPNRISVSRIDGKKEAKLANEDSLILERNLEEVRARLTPVSF